MKLHPLFTGIAAAFLGLSVSVLADEGTTRIGTANPSKILAEMQETKDLNKKHAAEQQKLSDEEQARVAELQKMKKDRDSFVQRNTPEWDKASEDILKKSIELQTWGELTKAHLQKKNKEELKALFDKIVAGVKDVAAQKKIDLVIADFAVEIPSDLDQVNPDQLHAMMRQQNILLTGKGVDISSDVIVLLDTKYKSGK